MGTASPERFRKLINGRCHIGISTLMPNNSLLLIRDRWKIGAGYFLLRIRGFTPD